MPVKTCLCTHPCRTEVRTKETISRIFSDGVFWFYAIGRIESVIPQVKRYSQQLSKDLPFLVKHPRAEVLLQLLVDVNGVGKKKILTNINHPLVCRKFSKFLL